jgi:nucleotide-binding universal stress UspA family protein
VSTAPCCFCCPLPADQTAGNDAMNRGRNQSLDLIERIGGGNAFPIPFAVERSDATHVVLDKETEYNADLIVIGKQGRSALEGFFLGSVTRHILSNSKCNVLVVHEKRPE